ncbi:gluconolactonase [Sphingomonas gei]|uniref:Gluconolactonase n=1 Tax=Sphingomonas gei TaxID=1395960 RepID=A0A4S1WZQ2_9SPHN|nr:SMP-30/gluconolactonase/LRE family protein [Sphingomonas gei]TGX49094.1 gluconolactonase [Sphingomonas gei]
MVELELVSFADGFILPEGPRWHDGHLWISDIFGKAVYRIDPSGKRDLVAEVPGMPSGLGFLSDGTVLVASMEDRTVHRINDGKLEPYADLADIATGHLNDMMVDEADRAYVGNFGYDFFNGAPIAPAKLALIEPGQPARVVADDLIFPNGSVLIDDGRTFVIAETFANRLTAYRRAADGSLSDRRIYADLGSISPDGLAVDAEDGIWAASFTTGEFVRVLDGGTITHRIACPGMITLACALGGPDGHTLYCMAYSGTVEDAFAGETYGAVWTTRVPIGAKPARS